MLRHASRSMENLDINIPYKKTSPLVTAPTLSNTVSGENNTTNGLFACDDLTNH